VSIACTLSEHLKARPAGGAVRRRRIETSTYKRVLKIDGAYAPKVLRFDGAFGPEGCGIALSGYEV